MANIIDKRTKLLDIKRKLENMPNNIRRVKTIEGYANLFSYYKEVTGLEDKECVDLDLDEEFVNKYDKYVVRDTHKKIKEVSRLAPYLYQRFNKLIELYKKNGFCSYEFSITCKTNVDEMYNNIVQLK